MDIHDVGEEHVFTASRRCWNDICPSYNETFEVKVKAKDITETNQYHCEMCNDTHTTVSYIAKCPVCGKCYNMSSTIYSEFP